ncbi:MAG: type 4a pilus biogenesis protein PilO [Methylovulum sp.]
MNLSEINWDFNAAGTWPLPIKAAIILLISAVVIGGGVYFDTLDQLTQLENVERKEKDLKREFETKQNKAINLQDYKDQLAQIEAELYEMIRQMPTEEEIASLLTDISQTGLASGLEFKLFKPGPAIAKDFYSEVPITIQVVGKYDELGLFVSGLAALPRIVTVHDVSIIPQDDGAAKKENKDGKPTVAVIADEMLMNATVKTYNEGTGPVPEASDAKKKRGKKEGASGTKGSENKGDKK